MLAEVSDVKENEIEIKVSEEDISVLYVVQHELLKERSIDFAGVVQKHPLAKEYQLRVVTKRKDPMEVIQDASANASEYAKDLLGLVKSALKK